jgi:hypothetical protein
METIGRLSPSSAHSSAVDPLVAQLPREHLLALGVARGVEDDGVTVAGEQRAADAHRQGLLPQVLERAAEQAHHAAAPAGQRAGDGVGLIAQLLGGPADPLLRLFRRLDATQRIRNGGRREPRCLRHFADGRALPLLRHTSTL